MLSWASCFYISVSPNITNSVLIKLLLDSKGTHISKDYSEKVKTVEPTKKAKSFYQHVIELLLEHKFRFMIGGAYALYEHTGVHRKTKDLDIFCLKDDFPAMLEILADAGYETELTELDWVAKVIYEKDFVDFIYADPQGFYMVDESWFERAQPANVLGYDVCIIPPEEMLISKLYRQRRNKYEGPDIVHLILRKGNDLDWKRIYDACEKHWQLFFAHLLNFWFIYPSERYAVPQWVYEKLTEKIEQELVTPPPKEKVSRGLLLSKNEYAIGISEWGFSPFRTPKEINKYG